MQEVKTGVLVGNGAAVNVELGYVPDYVSLTNMTDADKITTWFRGKACAFTSGGTNTVGAGDTITGATTGAVAKLKDVLISSGSFAAGDAAGFFVFNEDDWNDINFGSENVYVTKGPNYPQATSGTNDATVTVQAEVCVSLDTEVGAETGNAAISSYKGDATHAPGFTIGSTVAEEAKLLRYFALRETL